MLLRGDISLTSGSVNPQHAIWQDEQLFVGLKIIIIESGELLCRFPQQAERHSVAYQVGYSPAHFSVAFRKKYGFAPKDMRG
jgi:methylphosphotriester-DNA--protein-cysteine methyltransferase